MALNQEPDPRTSHGTCLAANQANKRLPIYWIHGCLNRPPPKKPRLLEETQAIGMKRILTLIVPSPNTCGGLFPHSFPRLIAITRANCV